MVNKVIFWRYFLLALVCLLMLFFLFIETSAPSNDLDWEVWHEVMPYGEIEGDTVRIYNIRNFSWKSAQEADVSYFNETFNLSSMDRVYFLVEHWTKWDAMAHTMFSFEYGEGKYIVVSVESRKEKGEKYSATLGFFNKYELIYVFGTETDMFPLRTYYYNDSLYMYPIMTTSENVQKLFVDVLTRANSLRENPEWYNTLTSSCTTNLVDHAEKTSSRVRAGMSKYLPGLSDKVAYELGLIDTDLPFENIREEFDITRLSSKFRGQADFSDKIRRAEFN